MFGIGLREFLVIAFLLVLIFGLKFWVQLGRRVARAVRERFRID